MLSGRIALERPEVDQLAVTTTIEQPTPPDRYNMTYRRRVWPKRRKPVRSSMSLAAARERRAAEKARAERQGVDETLGRQYALATCPTASVDEYVQSTSA